MKKIDLGQILNTLANVGVIAGIVFLAFELRQNNDLLTSQARVARHELRSNDTSRIVLQNVELLPILVKARANEVLTPNDLLALDMYLEQWILDWQFVFVEWQQGLLGNQEIPVEGWKNTIAIYPRFHDVWNDARLRGLYQEDFVEWMDENVVN